jgi:hypothetical protein
MKAIKYRPSYGPARRWHKCKARKKLPREQRPAKIAHMQKRVREMVRIIKHMHFTAHPSGMMLPVAVLPPPRS